MSIAGRTNALEINRGTFSKPDYERRLSAADIVLLPYDPRHYANSISGVAYEAMSLGAVIVAPSHCSIHREALKYAYGAAFSEEWTPQSIARALGHAVDNFAALSERAKAGRINFNAENGPGPYAEAIVAFSRTNAGKVGSPSRPRFFMLLAKYRAKRHMHKAMSSLPI
jgi:glycosyltransferase involved in cell wall biosynthesis